jgi:homoserine O-succinyltransferase
MIGGESGMTLLCDRHRLIVSPTLAPAQASGHGMWFDGRDRSADDTLTIGLINNMQDGALAATERQFLRLLTTAAGHHRIHFHCFSLPSVERSHPTKSRLARVYSDIADLDRLHIDGMIVTGAEPSAATLPEEPFWRELTEIVDWARSNTRSTIFSCLAAHAAVLHLDDIERRQLGTKCSGVQDCFKVSSHWLTRGLPSPVKVAHSRLNEVRASDLVRSGYQLVTHSPDAGVDIFARQMGSHFIFFQGHPEYEALSLEREYLRDISRFLGRERDTYPAIPTGYFDTETEDRLGRFARLAKVERRPALSDALPERRLRDETVTAAAAVDIFRNWLDHLSNGMRAGVPLTPL